MALLGRRFFKCGMTTGRTVTKLNERFSGWTSDVLGNIKFFKATASEQVALAKLREITAQLLNPTTASAFTPQFLRSNFELTATLLFITFVVVGIKVLHMDFLSIVVILGIFTRILPRLAMLHDVMQFMSGLLPAAGKVRFLRLAAIAMAEPLRPVATDGQPAGPHPANHSGPVAISMRGINVVIGAQPVLRDVDIEVPAGSFTAIVGASGAGKTTLIDCLLGLVEMQAGEITIDGVDIAEIGFENWRPCIAFQPQDPVMLNGTIRENIGWAEQNVTEASLDEAARKAGILRFMQQLPGGFDSDVGDRGAKLSGGQRQRVGLARALLSHKRLLILDEATSALDAATEKGVVSNIVQLAGEMTIIMITHRLATVQQADRIYVLDHGQIVESGNWAELMRRNGAFRELWSHQLEDSAPK
jgi:ATP-binding cassette subfamily C protein